MALLNTFTRDNLDKQGFEKLSDEAKSRYSWPLRFTPFLATVVIVFGLVLQSPTIVGAMSLVALSGALLPRRMVFDLVYNLGVRHLFRAPALPATPKPRRFSYLLSTIWLAGSALSFSTGLPLLGLTLGAMVVFGSATLTLTLWCLGSWWYRLIFGAEATEC